MRIVSQIGMTHKKDRDYDDPFKKTKETFHSEIKIKHLNLKYECQRITEGICPEKDY